MEYHVNQILCIPYGFVASKVDLFQVVRFYEDIFGIGWSLVTGYYR